MSVYYTNPEKTEYVISLHKDDGTYYMECSEAVINGEKKLLHNEISCGFVIEDGKMVVLNGWHIGTDDFSWSEKGYDWVLEEYHPGITEQIMKIVEGMGA